MYIYIPSYDSDLYATQKKNGLLNGLTTFEASSKKLKYVKKRTIFI